MDGAESSSESEMEVDDESEEEINTKVRLFFKWAYKKINKQHFSNLWAVSFKAPSMLFL